MIIIVRKREAAELYGLLHSTEMKLVSIQTTLFKVKMLIIIPRAARKKIIQKT